MADSDDRITLTRVADQNGVEQFTILELVQSPTGRSTGHFLNKIGPLTEAQAAEKLRELLGSPSAEQLARHFRSARSRFSG